MRLSAGSRTPRGFGGTLLDASLARLLNHLEQRSQDFGNAVAADGGDDQRRLFGCTLEPGCLLFDFIGRQCIGFVERDYLRLVDKAVAVSCKLRAHRVVGLTRVAHRPINEVEENPAPLDVTEETVTEADAFMRPLDQAGNIGEHEFAPVASNYAKLRLQRRERIIGDLRLGGAYRGEECRFSRIRQPDKTGVCDQFEPQTDCALFAGQSRIGAARDWLTT